MNLSERLAINSTSELPLSPVTSLVKTENLLRCPICNKLFRRSGSYVSHLRGHRRDKPYKCTFCLNSYMQSSSLSRHMRIHAGERPLKCRFCRRSFSQASALSEHLKQHIGEKRFQCSFCPTYFVTPEGCRRHMENHTQDRPFACTQCPASFHSISTLLVHKQLHRKAKPFKSADSLKSIACYLQPHRSQTDDAVKERLHCNMCGKSFSQLRFLQMHKRIYMGEKQLKCRFCLKSFAQFCVFQRHLRIHSREQSASLQPSENHLTETNFEFEDTRGSDISRTSDDDMMAYLYREASSTSLPENSSVILAGVFGCGFCDKTFLIEKEFMDHCVSHSPSMTFDFCQFISRRLNGRMPRFFGWL